MPEMMMRHVPPGAYSAVHTEDTGADLVEFGSSPSGKSPGLGVLASTDPRSEEAVAGRLRVAKALSFFSGAGMVAWNKFSSLWLLSVGLSPAQVGLLKTAGLVAKSICQPVWALLADMRVPARLYPALAPVSLHVIALCSGLLSLVLMEVLHLTAAGMGFTGILLVRTAWATVNSGSQLTDALVAHMSHKTKEGFGRQRLWGSIAWGGMSLVAGQLIDAYGLDALFGYTFVARSAMMACTVFAMRRVVAARDAGCSLVDDSGGEKMIKVGQIYL